MTLHPSAQKFAESARKLGMEIDVVEFAKTTRTAQEAADTIGVSLGQIVKSLMFLAASQPVMALMSGPNRLDERQLAGYLGISRKKIKRADAGTVRAATGFAIGGVPPFGHATELPIFVDKDLLQYDEVWAAAGTPYAVFAVAPQTLVAASNGRVADLKNN